jgi:hypothetical protein
MNFLTLIGNKITEFAGLVVSAGAGDAGKLVATDSSGRLDDSVMPVGIGADTKLIVTSEALTAGDYVNIYDVSGTATCRKASAADATKPAHGFVLDNVSSAANATVYFEGPNTGLTGLTAGTTYVLSAATPGAVVALASAPAAAGNTLQVLGVATAAAEINTEIGQPIVRAA